MKTLLWEVGVDPAVGFEYIILKQNIYLENDNFFPMAIISYISIHLGQLSRMF